MSSISEESPLADQLKSAVQAKAIEHSWTQDEDDTSLAEYIVLMVANGKTQDQIAAELSGDLLQDAGGIEEFTHWLTDYVAKLTGAGGHEEPAQSVQAQADTSIPAAYENDLGESAPDNAYVEPCTHVLRALTSCSPKGPKGLHGGPRGGRGGRNSASGRGGFDAALHRTRGNDRISNNSTRGAPKGPKNIHNKDVRPGMQKALNGLQGQQQQQQMQHPMMPGAQGAQFMPPQQQMEFMAMMEQQARMLAQFMPNMAPPGMNGNPAQNGQPGQNGRSMFDRVERGRGGANIRGRGRGANQQNGAARKPAEAVEGGETQQSGDTAMDTEPTSAGAKDPSSTVCYFNLRCLNKDCAYAHQSPAAPPGTEIDMSNTCSFAAACKNSQCHGKHPSPALIAAYKAEQECRFGPNCNNPNCPFKHPTKPLCSFGASCTNKDCKFTHLQTKCKFNPCTNSRCPYQHEPGQNRNMSAFSWSKDQANQSEQQNEEMGEQDQSHVSNRKFVTEDEEEFIKPDEGQDNVGGETKQEEVPA